MKKYKKAVELRIGGFIYAGAKEVKYKITDFDEDMIQVDFKIIYEDKEFKHRFFHAKKYVI